MQLYNDTPFAISTTVFKSEPKAPILTLIVKGTFVVDGGELRTDVFPGEAVTSSL